MIIGQTIRPNASTPTQLYYFTPWIPRNGDFGEFQVDLMNFNDSTSTLDVDIWLQTKNSEEIDSAATLASATPIALNAGAGTLTITTHSGTFSGAKELVRFRFQVAGVRADDWVHIRAINISWATN